MKELRFFYFLLRLKELIFVILIYTISILYLILRFINIVNIANNLLEKDYAIFINCLNENIVMSVKFKDK